MAQGSQLLNLYLIHIYRHRYQPQWLAIVQGILQLRTLFDSFKSFIQFFKWVLIAALTS